MIRHSTNFILHSKTPGTTPYLECRLKWNGGRHCVALNVGVAVDPSKWSRESQRAIARTYHGKDRVPAASINREIERFISAADRIFGQYNNMEKWPAVDEVRQDWKAELGLAARRNLGVFEVFDMFVWDGESRLSWSKETIKKFHTVRNYLTGCKSSMTWDDFAESGLTRYVDYLRDDVGLLNSTIGKHVTFLKTFLRWADSRGYMTRRDYVTFRPVLKYTRNRVIFLEWDELMSVWNRQFTGHLGVREITRDVFCFCCFTGMRFSDAMQLRWSDVGPASIVITTVKTMDTLEIELNKYSSEILSRYRDRHIDDDRVFPSIANQVMNRNLKELMKDCGIDAPTRQTYYKKNERIDEVKPKYEYIGTHTARRTFICNALMLGVSPTVVMQWTGHRSYESMKPYVGVANETRRRAMSLFDR